MAKVFYIYLGLPGKPTYSQVCFSSPLDLEVSAISLEFTTPVNKDPASLPKGVRTRIILYPALLGGFDNLVQEFKDIINNSFMLLNPDDIY